MIRPEQPWHDVHEECGVVAVFRKEGSAAELVHRALFALQHRGQEAAGICSWGDAEILHHLRDRKRTFCAV